MNNRGQLDFPIVTFLIIIVGLLLLAPIILKVFGDIKTPMSNALNSTSGGQIAAANFDKVMDTAINFWDKVVISAFILSTLLLFISAFMIDTSPFWIVLYIFISFMLVIFAPTLSKALDKIYEAPAYATTVAQLGFMDFVRVHLGEVLVGIIVVTGIIIYGKVAFFSSGGRK